MGLKVLEGVAALLDAVAWPSVVAFGVWWLKEPVTRLIDRINKGRIGPTGGEFETLSPVADQQQKIPESPAEETRELIEVAGAKHAPPLPDELLDPLSQATADNLERAFPNDRETQFQWLLRIYAGVVVEKGHEENYRMIFGSQIGLLVRLNQAGGGLFMSAARAAFEQAVANWPEIHRGRTFDQWLGFLIAVGLAHVVPPAVPTGEAGVAITPAGRSFLKYVLEKQLPEKIG